jgi:hypothetical protein
MAEHLFLVIPAKAGIQSHGDAGRLWTPAFAGVAMGCARVTNLGGCNG